MACLYISDYILATSRSSDTCLSILLETPGIEYLQICGMGLPTYGQVLLCYLAHILVKNTAKEDSSKRMKLSRQSSSCVVAKDVECQQKAHIITIHKAKISEKMRPCIQNITILQN